MTVLKCNDQNLLLLPCSVDGGYRTDGPDEMAFVRHTGAVTLMHKFVMQAVCPIDVKYFPFDDQHCSFFVRPPRYAWYEMP